MENPNLSTALAVETPVSEIISTRKSQVAIATMNNVAIFNSNNAVLLNHASDSTNRMNSTIKSAEHKAVASSVFNRTGRNHNEK